MTAEEEWRTVYFTCSGTVAKQIIAGKLESESDLCFVLLKTPPTSVGTTRGSYACVEMEVQKKSIQKKVVHPDKPPIPGMRTWGGVDFEVISAVAVARGKNARIYKFGSGRLR